MIFVPRDSNPFDLGKQLRRPIHYRLHPSDMVPTVAGATEQLSQENTTPAYPLSYKPPAHHIPSCGEVNCSTYLNKTLKRGSCKRGVEKTLELACSCGYPLLSLCSL
ncbi:hypothetical protein I7I53_00159 [Histoplasma capsulatum var. duboisii H88]|uniref:Uncharacterized protein n=1 Tax=Ajellomyces capsulatus (strain H88) TaxID=544711 RepID=A0A8A1LM07_AJEC8|nr:hypothetical protein I7I53_00159 [Histoplasma capsulatum var. duboisii H88]